VEADRNAIDRALNTLKVGTRPEIADSPAHARALREQAQRRARP